MVKRPDDRNHETNGETFRRRTTKMGSLANEVRTALTEAISSKQQILETEAINEKLKSETIDVTLPGTAPSIEQNTC